jgi:hypothetical protein
LVNTANTDLSIGTNDTTRITVQADGDVGIGTALPSTPLHVHRNDGNGSTLQLTNADTGAGTSGLGLRISLEPNESASIKLSEAQPMVFATNNTDRMTIDGSGNIGIGTASPDEKLHVSGNIKSDNQIFSGQNVISSGATVDFDDGNVQVLQSVGASAITLNNMEDGAAYTLMVTDATSRTYTFTNCTNTHYSPTNGATTASTHTTYTILKVTVSSATHCYISWITGFSP